MFPVYVLTNDKHLFLLRGFSTCFLYFWPGQSAVIAGFQPPNFFMPESFPFLSLGRENIPVENWSDGLLKLCDRIAHRHFILMLEDYWLHAPVNLHAIAALFRFMRRVTDKGQEVLRIDLSSDRQNLANARDVGDWEGIPIIESLPDSPYQMSFQAAIWDRDTLRNHLRTGWTPWQAEIQGTENLQRLGADGPKVYGTLAAPLHYQPVYRSGRGRWQVDRIPGDLLEKIGGVL